MLLLHRSTTKVPLMYLPITGLYPLLASHVSYSNMSLSAKSMSTLYVIIYSAVNSSFIAGRSTCTNILECLNDWTCNLQDGFATAVIYIDFSKAFDVIQHDKLFVKLRSYGIDGILLQWIINLFTNRLFCTRIDDY